MPTIGNTIIGGTTGTTDASFFPTGFISAGGLTYTAVSGDVVTQVAAYGSGSGQCQIAIYTVSGGVPATMVGSPVTVTVGASAGWHTASCSIALTAGVEYTIGIDLCTAVGQEWTWHRDLPGGNQNSNNQTNTALQTTWTHSTYGGGRHSFYATVGTSGGSFTGSGAITEITDTAAGIGDWTAVGITGSGAVTEAVDAVAGTGTWIQGPVTGTAAVLEADDVTAGVGDWTGAGASAVIGNTIVGATATAVTAAFNNQGFLTASGLTYTATAGDTVTEVAVYGADTAQMQVAIYTISGGIPDTLVGTPTTINVGASAAWHTASCSIALTAGVEYTVCWDYYVDQDWTFYRDNPGGTFLSRITGSTLPATWAPIMDNTGTGRFSVYATVTTAGSTTTTGTAAVTEAVDIAAGIGAYGSAPRTGTATLTETDDVTTGVGDYTPLPITGNGTITEQRDNTSGSSFEILYPASISGRKLLDQNGDVHLHPTMSSWGMNQQLTDAEITTALEQVAAAGFKGVVVWIGGGRNGTGWNQYTTVDHGALWTGTPWASSLGPGWATTDHIVAECARLGLVLTMSLCSAFGDRGAGIAWEGVTNTNMYNAGVAVAARYLDSPNILWHVMFDQGDTPASTRGIRVNAFFDGVNDTEGASTRPVRWIEQANGATTVGQGWYLTGDFQCSINCIYSYDNDSVVRFEAGWAGTSGPTGDCEPPYVGAPHYEGIATQQFRERNYAVFIEGGCLINFSHEDWSTFTAPSFYSAGLEWYEVFTDSTSVLESTHCWTFIDEHLRDTTYGPVSTFVTTGEGTGDTKAAQGASTTKAVAYFPDNRTVVVDTTILAGTANVRLRWYDPTAGTYTTIATSEAQQTGRSVTLPAAHADTSRDWVLIAESVDRVGTGTITEGDDITAGDASFTGGPVSGTGAVTEADDITAGVGDWTAAAGSFAGSAALTETDDVTAGVGDWTGTAVTYDLYLGTTQVTAVYLGTTAIDPDDLHLGET